MWCRLTPFQTIKPAGADMDLWEKIIVGILMLLVVLWFLPGTRNMIEASKDAPKDWEGFLIPIGAVILFIVFLVLTL